MTSTGMGRLDTCCRRCNWAIERRPPITARTAGPEIIFSVRDNGVGFDPRYTGKLFQVFSRLHSAGEFEGTGIGLALVRRIVARHGGRTWAEGEPGRGACISFAFPNQPFAANAA